MLACCECVVICVFAVLCCVCVYSGVEKNLALCLAYQAFFKQHQPDSTGWFISDGVQVRTLHIMHSHTTYFRFMYDFAVGPRSHPLGFPLAPVNQNTADFAGHVHFDWAPVPVSKKVVPFPAVVILIAVVQIVPNPRGHSKHSAPKDAHSIFYTPIFSSFSMTPINLIRMSSPLNTETKCVSWFFLVCLRVPKWGLKVCMFRFSTISKQRHTWVRIQIQNQNQNKTKLQNRIFLPDPIIFLWANHPLHPFFSLINSLTSCVFLSSLSQQKRPILLSKLWEKQKQKFGTITNKSFCHYVPKLTHGRNLDRKPGINFQKQNPHG